MIALLDTHAIVWLATGDQRLGTLATGLIFRASRDGAVAYSAVSFWEIATLREKGRLGVLESPTDLRNGLLATGVEEVPLTGEIALLSAELGLHRDPADRLIAATAYAHDAVLVTADEHLLKWKHSVKRQDARR